MHDKLLKIQSELKVPKAQKNSFGNYNYRSCEDIVEAVKPLCEKHGVVLTLTDEVVQKGTHAEHLLIVGKDDKVFGLAPNYVKATAKIASSEGEISCEGWAREAVHKKGMDDAQITGAASSYARKYALNGLFAIDDTKDADSTNTHGKGAAPAEDDEDDLDII